MAKQVEVHEINDGSQYLVATKSGNNVDNVTYSCDKPLDLKELGKHMGAQLKNQDTLRKVYGSALATIAKDTTLTAYLGKYEKGESKIPKNFKDAFNKAEDAFFTEMVKTKQIPVTKEFIANVRETEVRNKRDPAAVTPHEIEELWTRYVVSQYRTEDKNYANVKSTVLKFMVFVGLRPENVQGFLIPVAAMQAMIKENMEPVVTDNSYAARVDKLIKDIAAEKQFKEEDARKCLTLLLSLTSTVKAVVAGYDEAATQARVATNAAGTTMQRAPRPEGAAMAIASAKEFEEAPL